MEGQHTGGGGAGGVVMILVYVAIYVYSAITLYTIANKAGADSPWMAWVPILNLWLQVEIAGAPWWWFLLFFVPVGNIVAVIIIGIGMAQAIDKPAWMGGCLILPGVNLVMLGLMAWT